MSARPPVTADAGKPRISRRESLKWFGMMLAGSALTPYPADAQALKQDAPGSQWPDLDVAPVRAPGYGQDPDLVALSSGPWPRTLNDSQLLTINHVADILVPREDEVPSAAELHVEEVVDEWVSAPYDQQRHDREVILPLLEWLDAESLQRFDRSFADADADQRLEIVDDIAWLDAPGPFRKPAVAFGRLRSVVVAAFFCTPEGSADLGYLGGKAIAGEYPGPSEDARRHLADVLDLLGLEPVEDPAEKA